MIGLVPYSFHYDNKKAFSVCPRNLQYIFTLKNLQPESVHDKLLVPLLSDRLKRRITEITEKDADPAHIALRQNETVVAMYNILQWEAYIAYYKKPNWVETIETNTKILEDYINLCIKNGAQPVGVVWPLPPIIHRHYPQEMLDQFRQRLLAFEKSYSFVCIDLFDLPTDYEYFRDMAHLNLKGSAAASTVLNEKLHELGILPLSHNDK